MPVVKNPIAHIKIIVLKSIKIGILNDIRHNKDIDRANVPAKKPPKAILSEPMALDVTTEEAKKNAPIKAIIFPNVWLSESEFWKITNNPIIKITKIVKICFGSLSFKNIWLKIAENIGEIDSINKLEATDEFNIENI